MPDAEKKLFKAVDFLGTLVCRARRVEMILPEFCETLKSLLLKFDLEHRTPLHMSLCRALDEMIADTDFVRLKAAIHSTSACSNIFAASKRCCRRSARAAHRHPNRKDW